MLKKIMTASGVQFRPTRWPRPPAGTYAVIFDDVDRDAADRVTPPTSGVLPAVIKHNGTIEVYEDKPDPDAEAAIEAAINAQGLSWTKQDRYWLQDAQRYQVVYELSYVDKT